MSIVVLGGLSWAVVLLVVVSVCTVAGRADRVTAAELRLSPIRLLPDVPPENSVLPTDDQVVGTAAAPRRRGAQHGARAVSTRGH